MEYVALLRGINVGGKNKVVMSELREQIADEGHGSVRTYINSGNLLFEADAPRDEVAQSVEYLAELSGLPEWWRGDAARRDALFYTRGLDRDRVRERIEAMPLGDEAVHFGQNAVFWGKFNEAEFLRTTYHKHLLREDFYRQVTIRSGATVERIASMLSRY